MEKAKPASSTAEVDRNDLECVQDEIVSPRRAPDEQSPPIAVPSHDDRGMARYEFTSRTAPPIVDAILWQRMLRADSRVPCADVRYPEIAREDYPEEKSHRSSGRLQYVGVCPNTCL